VEYVVYTYSASVDGPKLPGKPGKKRMLEAAPKRMLNKKLACKLPAVRHRVSVRV
jgi:hypothetical protein